MKVKLKAGVDISSLELRELSAFDTLKKDTIYDVLLIEMYEGKIKFINKIQKHIDTFEYFKMLSGIKLEFALDENRSITVIIKGGK